MAKTKRFNSRKKRRSMKKKRGTNKKQRRSSRRMRLRGGKNTLENIFLEQIVPLAYVYYNNEMENNAQSDALHNAFYEVEEIVNQRIKKDPTRDDVEEILRLAIEYINTEENDKNDKLEQITEFIREKYIPTTPKISTLLDSENKRRREYHRNGGLGQGDIEQLVAYAEELQKAQLEEENPSKLSRI
jgi:hypothetical protein